MMLVYIKLAYVNPKNLAFPIFTQEMNRMKTLRFAAFAGLLLAATQAPAAVLTEDFEAPFPAWESGWLGTNSNLQNFYGIGGGRGNNPDGLWLDDGDGVFGSDTSEIVFNPVFGATLTGLALDVAGYVGIRLQIFDMSNSILLDQIVALTGGAFTDPGTYSSYSVNSANGISRFAFVPIAGSQVEGNTSIDNVVVSTGGQQVPEPATLALLGLGFAGMFLSKRRSKA